MFVASAARRGSESLTGQRYRSPRCRQAKLARDAAPAAALAAQDARLAVGGARQGRKASQRSILWLRSADKNAGAAGTTQRRAVDPARSQARQKLARPRRRREGEAPVEDFVRRRLRPHRSPLNAGPPEGLENLPSRRVLSRACMNPAPPPAYPRAKNPIPPPSRQRATALATSASARALAQRQASPTERPKRRPARRSAFSGYRRFG